ncbi:putative membrane protein [Okibacterium sp. HSC-33S16]|uniref:YhgE/Pip domain-containing protein n=1 Tax=Okibacterium sp. HSC-33S16 TaxID=2910965 RepID=UPI00209CD8DA|nr:YhgE/Pip domain-containing protein [Okibacterium sp. HSC-33S16]MCP2030611.1 putative membrane protein [Okibacterium sp. HSC-33S16]
MSSLLSRLKGSAKTLVVLVGISLIPVIYSGALIWANQDPTHNLDGVPAALVNLDKPATLGDQTLDVGATLTEDLITSDSETNFDWTEMDEAGALSALNAGDVLAVLTIPADFSAHAISVGDSDALSASTAGLSIRTNDGANLIAGSIASNIGSAVRSSLAAQLSEEYLQNIYIGFSTVHDKVAEAADGADRLVTGTASVEDGAGELVVGLNDLADGSALLADGATSLSAGAAQASSGADALATSLNSLAGKTAELPRQADQLVVGAQATSAGAVALADSLTQLDAAAKKVTNASSSAFADAQALQGNLGAVADGTSTLSDGTKKLTTALNVLVAQYSSLTDEQRLSSLDEIISSAEGLDSQVDSLSSSAGSLGAGAAALVGTADAGTGLAALAAASATTATGAEKAATGASELSNGAVAVATGAANFSSQLPQVTSAIGSLASGAGVLRTGVAAVGTGAETLSTKTGALAVGSLKARDGGDQLNTGLADLEAGENTLSGGLRNGLEDIPSYTTQEADHLSSVASEPVSVVAERENEVPGYGYGLAPYFLALALWVGALAFYLMMQPLSGRALAGRQSLVFVALRSFVPGLVMGMVQSALAVFVVSRVVGIVPVHLWGLLGMMMLASVTFVAMNQALVALFGAPGRFIGLVMIVLQLSAAGGTYPIQTAPSFFQTIHSWLPLTYAVESFRSLIAGGDIAISQGIWVLLAWMFGALLVTTLAAFIARRSIEVPAVEQSNSQSGATNDENGALTRVDGAASEGTTDDGARSASSERTIDLRS